LAFGLRAIEGVTTDGGGYVTEWDDQSGNANNMFQPGGDAYAPLLVPNAINGMPALYFEATNLYNYMYAQPSASLAITGDMSVFAVMNFNSLNASGSTIVSKATVSLPSPYDYYVRSTAVQFYRGNGSVYGLVNGTSVPSTGVPHLLGVLMQGTGVLHRLDGTVNGTGTLSTTIADNPAQYVYIGARDDGTNQFNGQLAEMIVLGATASTNDTASIETYLAAKYFPAPMISVTQSAGNVVLSWPTPTFPFALQGTPTLSPSAWASVAGSVVSAGGVSTITLPATGNQMFYRLQEP
jgi:hypothetical protein